jgi:hypothetical protein
VPTKHARSFGGRGARSDARYPGSRSAGRATSPRRGMRACRRVTRRADLPADADRVPARDCSCTGTGAASAATARCALVRASVAFLSRATCCQPMFGSEKHVPAHG